MNKHIKEKSNNKKIATQSIIDIPQTTSQIGKHSLYDGELRFEKSVSVLGRVKGKIIGGELLIVYPHAVIEGDILVDYMLVMGTVIGNINARRGVLLYENSIVRGSVVSTVIRMQSGVDFEGDCNIIESEETDIFSFSREEFRTTLFDNLVHELDEASSPKPLKE